jgi:hypothetical protein
MTVTISKTTRNKRAEIVGFLCRNTFSRKDCELRTCAKILPKNLNEMQRGIEAVKENAKTLQGFQNLGEKESE